LGNRKGAGPVRILSNYRGTYPNLEYFQRGRLVKQILGLLSSFLILLWIREDPVTVEKEIFWFSGEGRK